MRESPCEFVRVLCVCFVLISLQICESASECDLCVLECVCNVSDHKSKRMSMCDECE